MLNIKKPRYHESKSMVPVSEQESSYKITNNSASPKNTSLLTLVVIKS